MCPLCPLPVLRSRCSSLVCEFFPSTPVNWTCVFFLLILRVKYSHVLTRVFNTFDTSVPLLRKSYRQFKVGGSVNNLR